MFCTNCGKPVKENSSFCPYCGAKLAGAQQAASAEPVLQKVKKPAPATKKNKTALIVLAAVIGLAVLGAGTYFLISSLSSPGEEKQASAGKDSTAESSAGKTETSETSQKPDSGAEESENSGEQTPADPWNHRNADLDARFEKDRLILKETAPVIDPDASKFTFPDELWDAFQIEKPEDPAQMVSGIIEEGDYYVISVSPKGNSGFIAAESLCVFYNDEYHIVYPSLSRGGEKGTARKQMLRVLSGKILASIGSEGIQYSPDGRYAALSFWERVLYFAENQSPTLIDLSTGEWFCIQEYDTRIAEEKYGTILTSCFSEDGRYYYYTTREKDGEKMPICFYRYDLENGKTEKCFSTEYWVDRSLVQTRNGFMALDIGSKNEYGYVFISQQKDDWQYEAALEEEYSLVPWTMDYSLNSDYAVSAIRIRDLGALIALQVFTSEDPSDGRKTYWAIHTGDNQAVPLTREEMINYLSTMRTDPEPAYQYIQWAELSPDGYYALVQTRESKTGENKLLMIRLDDMAVRTVQGLDIRIFGELGGAFPMCEWRSDSLLLRCEDTIPVGYRFVDAG